MAQSLKRSALLRKKIGSGLSRFPRAYTRDTSKGPQDSSGFAPGLTPGVLCRLASPVGRAKRAFILCRRDIQRASASRGGGRVPACGWGCAVGGGDASPFDRYARRFGFRVIFFLAFLAVLPATTAYSCTLWGATGTKVTENATLIAKNRDNSRSLTTELRFVSRERGFRFMGLFDPEKDGYVVSGINEKGLTVINASAASLADEKRNVAKEDLTDRILTSFESVDQIMAEKTLFLESYPAFYMVADATKMALIEVAPAGKVSVKVTDEGILTHTNHYVDKNLSAANERSAFHSRKRLNRINLLLRSQASALTIEKFIALSEDKKEIRDGAIHQTCTPGTKVCTLASWVAFLPKEGPPDIYVKIERPDGTFAVQRMVLDSQFWNQTSKKLIP